MSIATWPVDLPDTALIEEYSRAFPDTNQRTAMDVGPAKVRRRSTAAVSPLKGSMYFTRDQFSDFQDFYKNDLLDGSLRFGWTDPISETTVELRFTEPPSWKVLGVGIKADFSLEILP